MQAAQIQTTVNIPQGQFLAMPHKYRAFVSGYRGGKTWVGSIAQCIHIWEHPKINMGYFAPTYPQIKDIFFPTIEQVAHDMGLRTEIKIGDKEVHYYSGRQYRGTTICRSMERPETIVGFKIGHGLVDELDTLKRDKAQDAWRKIIARMSYKEPGLKNGLDVTTTPEGFRFTYEMFVKSLNDKPELRDFYGLIQASTYDNAANLPDDYIPSLIATYPAELIDAYLNGQFVNLTSGTIYRSYNREANRSLETIEGNEALYIGMDFNVEHMAATIYVKRKNGWHAVAELSDIFDTPDMVRAINERWPENKKLVYPDASGKSRKTNDASTSDLAILRQAGFKVKVKSTNPAVKDRIMAVNKAFESATMWINDKQCTRVAECLEQQTYDKNGEPDKKSGNDHQNDATGYPIAFEMPIGKPGIKLKVGF